MSAIEFPLKRIESISGLPAILDAKADVLTASKTVNIPFGSTASEIQALIDAEPKYLNGFILTFQLGDCPYKYFNGTTDKIVGNGTTATVTQAQHGFETGQEINISVIRERFFSGATSIVGDGTTATVTRNSHGFKDGDSVKIVGTINFDGTYEISAVTANTFEISHAYSGSSTPPKTASISSIDFDGDYTITVTDENTYTFASTVTGTIIPLSSGIARRVWNLGSGTVTLEGFNSGRLYILGNTSETNATDTHINQRVYIKTTGSWVFRILSCMADIRTWNIAAKAANSPLYIISSGYVLVYYCYTLNNSDTFGSTRIEQCLRAYVNKCALGSYNSSAKGSGIQLTAMNGTFADCYLVNRSLQYRVNLFQGFVFYTGTHSGTTTVAKTIITGGGIEVG